MNFLGTRAALIIPKGAPNARSAIISGIVQPYEQWHELEIQVNRNSQRTGSTIRACHDQPTFNFLAGTLSYSSSYFAV